MLHLIEQHSAAIKLYRNQSLKWIANNVVRCERYSFGDTCHICETTYGLSTISYCVIIVTVMQVLQRST